MKAKRKFIYQPNYAVLPGDTIREQVEHCGWSHEEFATRLGTTSKALVRIFKGDQPITKNTAKELERVLGAPARFWNNLEYNYRANRSNLPDSVWQIARSELLTRKFDWKPLA